jgi:hypothetical protein
VLIASTATVLLLITLVYVLPDVIVADKLVAGVAVVRRVVASELVDDSYIAIRAVLVVIGSSDDDDSDADGGSVSVVVCIGDLLVDVVSVDEGQIAPPASHNCDHLSVAM